MASPSSVSVCARFRPNNPKEIASARASSCIRKRDDRSFDFQDETEGELAFSFDKVFYEDASQEEVFEFVALPIVKDALNAINGTVLLYGQTGAGKTHSMEGTDDPKLRGIIPRVAQRIFQFIEAADSAIEFILKLSMVEIYMERIRDLLDVRKDNLQLKEDKNRGVFVSGASEVYLQTEQEMMDLVKRTGLSEPQVSIFTTYLHGHRLNLLQVMNANSSRSHCIYMITIEQANEDGSVKIGKLFLVDLAGSEKLEKTCAEGRLLTEAKTINKSLSSLGNVISALTNEKTCHVPYRDSKLTRILQDALGGNSRTSLLCCCSSSSFNSSETLSTLRFGLRAKDLKNRPKVNTERSRFELENMLLKAEKECERLRSQVIMLNARIHSLTGADKEALRSGQHGQYMDVTDKLRTVFSKKAPNLADVIEVIQELFEEEGLVSSNVEPVNDATAIHDLSKTLLVFENTVKDLVENLDKVSKEKEALEDEVLVYRELLAPQRPPSFRSLFWESFNPHIRKARIVRPLKGGLPKQSQQGPVGELKNRTMGTRLASGWSLELSTLTWSRLLLGGPRAGIFTTMLQAVKDKLRRCSFLKDWLQQQRKGKNRVQLSGSQ